MKSKIASLLCIMAFFSACIEYEIEEIKPTATPGPVFFQDPVSDFPFHKQFNLPDGPYDLGEPLHPDIELSFIQHDFGTLELFDAPLSKTLYIRNVGDYSLNITKVDYTCISNSYSFSTLPGSSILPGAQQTIDIEYNASIYGYDACFLNIVSDDPDESSIIVTLGARGATPELSLSATTVDFGYADVLDPPLVREVTLTNTGDGTLELSKIEEKLSDPDINISLSPVSKLTPGQQTKLSLTYSPQASGAGKERIKISSNDPTHPVHKIIATGSTADPDIDAPTLVDFGVSDIGVSITRVIDLDNVGSGKLHISGVYFKTASNAFSIVTNAVSTVPPATSAQLQVQYTPDDAASDSAIIEVISNDPTEPSYLIDLVGEPTVPEISVSPSPAVDYGMMDLGGSMTKTITVSNVGTGPLQISTIYFVGNSPAFSFVNSFAGSLAAGSSATIDIEYAPDDHIQDVSTVNILSDDPNIPVHSLTLSGTPGIPDIDIDPLFIDFGHVHTQNAPPIEKIRISNVGTGKLVLGTPALKFGSNYSLSTLASVSLDPNTSVELEVEYSPTSYKSDVDEISIISNDPVDPVQLVNIEGWGSAPQLEISPSPHDFGLEYLECSSEEVIDMKNIGDTDLTITDIEYFTSFPSHFSIDRDLVVNGQFPWVIPPGFLNSVYVEYKPSEDTIDSAFLRVHSDDPVSPQALSYQYGQGDYYASVTDTFTQQNVVKSDILFVIDNSCSMGSWQTHVASNFSSFFNVFVNSGVDYHIGIITTDDPTFVASVIDTSTYNPVFEFTQSAQVGVYGSGAERGLDMAYESLAPGGDAALGGSFSRPDAKLAIIFVSDEPDSSYKWGSVPSDYSGFFTSSKSDPSLSVSHAVGGDCPSGCSLQTLNSWGNAYNQYASCADDYDDVVSDMNGTFLSLCDTDWGLKMETLAKDSLLLTHFTLSDYPIENTLEVQVDGIVTGNWSFDPLLNTVIFDAAHVPVAGSIIDIDYNILGGC